MLLITGTARPAPGASDRLIAAVQDVSEATQGDPGCVLYQFSVSLDGDAIISVSDNGIGIDPAHHRRIFEPFGRAPDAPQRVDGVTVQGSGIGLAIVQQVAEAHGGHVWVESAPGVGTTFHLRLGRQPRAATNGDAG